MAPVRRFDGYQQRHPSLAIPLAVVKKFGDDQGGSLAALVAYYAFFSLFPLLLVFVTILGFVLQGDPSAQKSIENSALSQFPIVGDQLKQVGGLNGSVPALIIGLVTSLLAGLGVTQAAQNAFDRVWAVPFKDRPNFVQSRLRGLALLVSLGLLFGLATLASGLVTGGLGGVLVGIAGIAISLLLNFALFFAAFRLMTGSDVPTRDLRTGVIVAGILWEVLQVVGGYYIGHVLKNSKSTYGTFAIVIALLVWLHLGAQMTLYSAEVNVVVSRKLWPRSLFGGPTEPADKETLTALAKVEERSQEQQVEVEFKPSAQAAEPDQPGTADADRGEDAG